MRAALLDQKSEIMNPFIKSASAREIRGDHIFLPRIEVTVTVNAYIPSERVRVEGSLYLSTDLLGGIGGERKKTCSQRGVERVPVRFAAILLTYP